MSNRDKLRQLLLDVFLLTPAEVRFDLRKQDVDTWDSLGTVSLAVGVKDTFGYHLSPAEATGLGGVADLITILEREGIRLSE